MRRGVATNGASTLSIHSVQPSDDTPDAVVVEGEVVGAFVGAPDFTVVVRLGASTCVADLQPDASGRSAQWVASLPTSGHPECRLAVAAHGAHQVAVARAAVRFDTVGRATGSLDRPAHDSLCGDVLDVAGWCHFTGSAVARVEVFVNDRFAGRARTYLERPDMPAGPRHRDALICGYALLIPVRLVDIDTDATVFVRATALDGRTWTSPTNKVTIAPTSAPTGQVAEAAVVAQRTRAALSGWPTRTRRPKVVAVTHDMGYGGGQLWLTELLRQMQESDLFDLELIAFGGGPLRPVVEASGIPVHVTGMSRLDCAVAYEDSVRELGALLVSSGCSAVLVNTIGVFPVVDAADRAGLPIIWAIHESFDPAVYCHICWGAHMHTYVRERFTGSLQLPRALVFEAQQTADLFTHLGVASSSHVVDYGVDVAEIDAYRDQIDRRATRLAMGWSDSDVVLVVVGTFEGRKAQGAVVAAFDEIASVHENAHLVLVGAHRSDYTNAIRDQVTRSAHAARIRIVDVTPDVYLWYAISDLLVCSSDLESLPRSILEAMVFELPVLSTDAFGIATLLDDGATGWLMRTSDVEAMAGALHRVLMLSQERRGEVATAARAAAVARMTGWPYGQRFAGALRALTLDPDADVGRWLDGAKAPREVA